MSRPDVTTALLASASLALIACAALGGDNGGGANLPNRGVVPYERVVTDQTAYVFAPEGTVRYLDPSVLIDADSSVRLYLTVRDGDTSFIALATSDASGQAFSAPARILDGAAPSVIVADDGSYLMAYVTNDQRIDVASSTDGVSFTPSGGFDGRAGLAVTSPSLIQTDTGFELFYTEGETTIARATAGRDLVFTFDAVVFEGGTDCTDVAGEPATCWDADGVSGAEVRLSTTSAGRTLYRMFYEGTMGPNVDLGFAASEDGLTWSRYPFNPVVRDGLKQLGPTNARQGDRYLLYYAENANSGHGIALAINDAPAPSETF